MPLIRLTVEERHPQDATRVSKLLIVLTKIIYLPRQPKAA